MSVPPLCHSANVYSSSGLWQLCPFIRPLFVSQPTTGLSEYARSAVNNSHPLLWEIPPSIFLVFLLPTNVSCRGYMGHSWKGGWEVLHAAAMPFFSLTVYWMHLASLRGRSKPHTDTSKQWFFTRPRSLILTAWLADQWLAEASLESAPESLHPPPTTHPLYFLIVLHLQCECNYDCFQFEGLPRFSPTAHQICIMFGILVAIGI